MDITVRKIEKNEVSLAAEIEKQSLETPWSERQISELPENGIYLVAVCEETVCGIASMYSIAGEGQIMNIAVSESFRRKGVGESLINGLFRHGKENNCENITLEVAVNNVSAISLYKKCGFNAVGTRKGFYHGVDALIMEKIL